MRAFHHGISWVLLVAALSAPANAADFNADGRADILWRNAGSGQNALWFMNGAAITSGVFTDSVTDTNWRIVGVADFNGDGRADIFWRHSLSGQNGIWLMNGATVMSGVSIEAIPDLAWNIVGIEDFNGDGTADILWRHSVSGQNALWFMNGATVTSAASTESVTDTNWRIVGVADFNGDGRADIFWRHSLSGQNGIWLMNGATVMSGVSIEAIPDTAWNIVGVEDFNGDGTADILWRHSVSGQNALWFMNGATVTSAASTLPVTDPNWRIAGVADFNGDGRADIFWHHSVSGQNAMWLMNGATITSGQFTTATAFSWVVAPALGQVTVAFTPTANNIGIWDSRVPEAADAVFASSEELPAGCNISHSPFGGAQCYVSLVKFDLNTLAGKTIDTATLVLTTKFGGSSSELLHIAAPATAWSANSVTYNIAGQFQYYVASQIDLNPLTFCGQTCQVDLQTTVQAWANGRFANNGLHLDKSFPLNPLAGYFGETAFYSGTVETVSSRPTLIVTYR